MIETPLLYKYTKAGTRNRRLMTLLCDSVKNVTIMDKDALRLAPSLPVPVSLDSGPQNFPRYSSFKNETSPVLGTRLHKN